MSYHFNNSLLIDCVGFVPNSCFCSSPPTPRQTLAVKEFSVVLDFMYCTSAAFMQGYYSTLMSYLDWKYRTCTHCTYMYILYSCTFWITTIPDWSQSRAQKNFFSLKGFSEVGTGVIRGSSQECASQYAIRSAAAFDTWRGGWWSESRWIGTHFNKQ